MVDKMTNNNEVEMDRRNADGDFVGQTEAEAVQDWVGFFIGDTAEAQTRVVNTANKEVARQLITLIEQGRQGFSFNVGKAVKQDHKLRAEAIKQIVKDYITEHKLNYVVYTTAQQSILSVKKTE